MRVLIPTPLRSYTREASVVEAQASDLAKLLEALDGRYPGMRFRVIDEQGRIRQHIKFFVNRAQASSLATPLAHDDEVMIVCALSGG